MQRTSFDPRGLFEAGSNMSIDRFAMEHQQRRMKQVLNELVLTGIDKLWCQRGIFGLDFNRHIDSLSYDQVPWISTQWTVVSTRAWTSMTT